MYELYGIKCRQDTLIDIIIPTYGKVKMNWDCIESIKKQCLRKDYQIFLVDDGSPTEIFKQLEAKAKEIGYILVRQKTNDGFCKTINTGLRLSKASYKLLLNNDTIARNDFITTMIERAKSNPKIGIVGAKLVYPNNTIQFAGHIRNPYAPKWFDHKYRGEPVDFLPSTLDYEIISCTGACMLIKKEVIEKIGLPDESFPLAFEDVDFCFRAREVGFKVWYEPKAILLHFEGGTRGTGLKAMENPRQKASFKHFWEKWDEETVERLSYL